MKISVSELNKRSYENREGIWEEVDIDTFNALCNCCNNYNEIPILARSVYHYKKKKNPKYAPEDALVYTLERLDSNGQDFMSSMSRGEYNDILKEIY